MEIPTSFLPQSILRFFSLLTNWRSFDGVIWQRMLFILGNPVMGTIPGNTFISTYNPPELYSSFPILLMIFFIDHIFAQNSKQ